MPTTQEIMEVAGGNFLKETVDNTIRLSILLTYLRQSGGLRGEDGGYEWNQDVRFKQSRGRAFARGDSDDYAPNWEFKKSTFTRRDIKNVDFIHMLDVVDNDSQTKMVDYFLEKMPGIKSGLDSTLMISSFYDGSLDNDHLEGLDTFCKVDSGVAITNDDKVGIPDDMLYLTINTKPGTYNGEWSADLSPSPNAAWANDFPFGSGDQQYDFWSHMPFHDASTAYGHTVDTWRGGNCFDILDAASMLVRLRGGDGIAPTLNILSEQKMLDFQAALRELTRILLPHTESRELGFPKALEYNGTVVAPDFYCPAGRHYSINPNQVQLRYIQKVPEGFSAQGDGGLYIGRMGIHPTEPYYKYSLYFMGNFWFNPKAVAWSADLVA